MRTCDSAVSGFKNCTTESEFFTALFRNFLHLRLALDALLSHFLVDILIKI